jgi:hypothetical protein
MRDGAADQQSAEQGYSIDLHELPGSLAPTVRQHPQTKPAA